MPPTPRNRSAIAFVFAALSAGACSADRSVSPSRVPSTNVEVSAAVGSPGVVVLIGGGAEGNIGQKHAWSYDLYKEIVANGDVTGDGVVTIAILSPYDETLFIPRYFGWIGTTLGTPVVASNIQVATTNAANDPAVNARVGGADAVWVKGGDQGLYYDLWNGTQLETSIRAVIARGGAIGGTSAGAMSLAEYCLCGGQTLESRHVMQDAHTPFLDDASQPGTSGIHADFLGVVRGVFIDSHVTERARLGRLLGVLARANEDAGLDTLLGVGIESHTGIVLRQGVGEVRGAGSVQFVQQSPTTVRRRTAGHPLVYTQLRIDRLTEGWQFDFAHRATVVSRMPTGALPVVYPGPTARNVGALSIDGGRELDRRKFGLVAGYAPDPYSLSPTAASIFVERAIGMPHMGNYENRGTKDETLFRALYDAVGATGVFMFAGGSGVRTAGDPDRIAFEGQSGGMVVELHGATFRGLSRWSSYWSDRSESLHPAAFVGATLHAIGESTRNAMRYDTRVHAVVP